MAKIFISYSRSDGSYLRDFLPLIRRVYGNDSVWYDGEIHGGSNWWQMILEEVAKCELFIYLLSDESLESTYCRSEFREALRLNKQILPVIVRRLRPEYPGKIDDDLTPILRKTQYVDLIDMNDANAIASLLGAINRLLEVATTREVTTTENAITEDIPPTPEPQVLDIPKSPRDNIVKALGGDIRTFIAVMTIIIVLGIGAFIALNNQNQPNQETDDNDLSLEDALELAQTFEGGNKDWTPFAHVFPDDPINAEMMLVPVGEFMMGSDGGEGDERPPHNQTFLRPFWIERTEVSNEQFTTFLNDTNVSETGKNELGVEYLDADGEYVQIRWVGNQWQVVGGKEQHPVIDVSWFGARDYCQWRGGRLPTEKEWEYAARGPSNWVYPWESDSVDDWDEDNAVHEGNSGNETAVVGSRPQGASWVGTLDMSGNVWEWVSSLYAGYAYSPERESDMDTEGFRVVRGGSFDNIHDMLRGANRNLDHSVSPVSPLGMRCARSV